MRNRERRMDEIVALGQLETSSMRCSASRRNGPDARYRVRIHFDNLLRLAHADRPLRRRAWPTPPASRRHGYSNPTSGPITISSATPGIIINRSARRIREASTIPPK